MEIMVSAAAAAFTYCICMLFMNRVFRKRLRLSERITETGLSGEYQPVSEKKQELLSKRIIDAAFNRLLDVIEIFIPKSRRQGGKLQEDLRCASVGMTVERYKAMLTGKMFFAALLLAGFAKVTGKDIKTCILYAAAGLYGVFTLERFSLQGKIKKRREAIYHALPDMMDLLNVSVTAGLGFDQAISYIAGKGNGPLYEELKVTQHEITLGSNRREALTAFAERCGSNEIKTFVGACLQADAMGSSMQSILRIQADAIREGHKQDVETKINELPVKILFPIVFCIFPCLFLVLLGPAALTVIGVF